MGGIGNELCRDIIDRIVDVSMGLCMVFGCWLCVMLMCEYVCYWYFLCVYCMFGYVVL